MLSEKLLEKQYNSSTPKLCHHLTWNDEEVIDNEEQPEDAITQHLICISSIGLLWEDLHSAGGSSGKSQLPDLMHTHSCDVFQLQNAVWQARQQELPLEDGQGLKRPVEFLWEGNALLLLLLLPLTWCIGSHCGQAIELNWYITCHRKGNVSSGKATHSRAVNFSCT